MVRVRSIEHGTELMAVRCWDGSDPDAERGWTMLEELQVEFDPGQGAEVAAMGALLAGQYRPTDLSSWIRQTEMPPIGSATTAPLPPPRLTDPIAVNGVAAPPHPNPVADVHRRMLLSAMLILSGVAIATSPFVPYAWFDSAGPRQTFRIGPLGQVGLLTAASVLAAAGWGREHWPDLVPTLRLLAPFVAVGCEVMWITRNRHVLRMYEASYYSGKNGIMWSVPARVGMVGTFLAIILSVIYFFVTRPASRSASHS
jgi:hypothetical protein